MMNTTGQRLSAEKMQRRCQTSFQKLVPDPAAFIAGIDPDAAPSTRPSPLTGMETVALPKSRVGSLDSVIEKARAAQKRWARVPAARRARHIATVHDQVLTMGQELCDVIQWETGKARSHAYEEIQDIALTSRYYGRVSAKALRPQRIRGVIPLATRVEKRFAPKGIVGVISPWNYPLTLSLGDALAALAAGNAIVIKPDSNAPLTCLAAKTLLVRAGIHPDLFQIVLGSGKEIGTPLIEKIDYLMFTGSSATGANLAGQCGRNLIGCSAELGGKNAMIVTEKANLAAAARGAVAACYSNSGQLCISIERIYVQRSVYEQFKKLFVAQVQAMKVAANLDWETDMGVLITAAHLEKVHQQVQQAKQLGATVLTGGVPLPQLGKTGYAPTVLEGVTQQMELCRCETFGPVVSLYPYDTPAQAVALVNDSKYGLNASVWSTPADGLRLARQIESGTVNINEGYSPAWASKKTTMGGVKHSGLGRRHALEGLYKYTEPISIATQSRLVPMSAPSFMSKKQWARLVTKLLRMLNRLHLE